MKLSKNKILSGVLVGLMAVSTHASAALTSTVIIDFEAADDGSGPMKASVQPAFSGIYVEDGVGHSAIGFDLGGTGLNTGIAQNVGNFGSGGSHVHGWDTYGDGSRTSQLAPDAGGGFFEMLDGSAFSLLGLDVANIELTQSNGTDTTMTLRGYTSSDFSSWYDVTIGESGGFATATEFSTHTSTVANATTGLPVNETHLHLNEVAEFGSIYLFEYYFDASGRGIDPANDNNNNPLVFEFDDLELGAPVSAVPVPAAVYLFGSALLGMAGYKRKQVVSV